MINVMLCVHLYTQYVVLFVVIISCMRSCGRVFFTMSA